MFNPALNGGSVIRCFKHCNVIKIHDRITFDFYTGLPHMESDGGVVSPILFALYIDDLLYELELSGLLVSGMTSLWVQSLMLMTLVAPSPAALRRLLLICEQFGATNMLKVNPDKTQCIKFSRCV